jgi:hypothetical protein
MVPQKVVRRTSLDIAGRVKVSLNMCHDTCAQEYLPEALRRDELRRRRTSQSGRDHDFVVMARLGGEWSLRS